MDGFTTFAIHDSLGFTSLGQHNIEFRSFSVSRIHERWWLGKPHFQFIFSGCSEETRFPILYSIRYQHERSSVIFSELWQTGADSTQFNSFMRFIWKMLQIHPFAHSPHFFLIYLPNQFQSGQLFDVAGTSKAALIKMNILLPVSLSSFYN